MTTNRAIGRRTPGPAQGRRIPWMMVILFLLPAMVLYLLFVIYPVIQSLRYSLFEWNGLEELDNFVGMQNFVDAFSDPHFTDAMIHNGVIILLSLAIQLPVALGLAILLNRRFAGRGFFRVVFFAPFVLSEVVAGVVWRQILRPAGLLDQILAALGAEGAIQEWLANPDIVLYSMFVIISWKYFGFHMVIMLAGLQQIPSELSEAAAIDGASGRQIFRYVTFPLLAPTIAVSVFLSVVGALQLFDVVWATTQGGPIGASSTMATFLYEQFRRGQWGYASAVSIIIFLVCLVFALLYQRAALRRTLEGSAYA